MAKALWLWRFSRPADLNNLVPTVARALDDDHREDWDDYDHDDGSYQSLIKVINRPALPDGDRARSVYVIYLQSV